MDIDKHDIDLDVKCDNVLGGFRNRIIMILSYSNYLLRVMAKF
jgi:hypothetical protein